LTDLDYEQESQMERRWGRRAFGLGLIAGVVAGAAIGGVRLWSKLWKARAKHREESARRATEGVWPPVVSRLKGPARILAPLAHRVGIESHDGASGEDSSRSN
jgi:hypothetical protein